MNSSNWKTDRKRMRRAERLLFAAERDDARKAERQIKQLEAARIGAEREAAKQTLANEWNAIFAALKLPFKAETQTVHWSDGLPDPEVYVHSAEREKGWAKLVGHLQNQAK